MRAGIEGINVLRENEKKASRFISYRPDSLGFMEWPETRPSITISLRLIYEDIYTYAVVFYEAERHHGQLQSLRNTLYVLKYFLPRYKGKLLPARQATSGW